MPKASLEEIQGLLENMLAEQGIEITDIEYRQEHGGQMLRVFIDTAQGVQIETCSQATRLIQRRLDEVDLLYDYLEVSSPGMNRKLTRNKDFEHFKGSRVKVQLKQVWAGRKRFKGILLAYDGDLLIIEEETGEQAIPSKLIAKVNLDPEF